MKNGRIDADQEFRCLHCNALVTTNPSMGTKHRNHCPLCLWSKHVDLALSGDRSASCGGGMQPIGLTLKIEGTDKYTGKTKFGDLMLIHECTVCHKFSINRIAADDSAQEIIRIFELSASLPANVKQRLANEKIMLLGSDDRTSVESRLYGKRA